MFSRYRAHHPRGIQQHIEVLESVWCGCKSWKAFSPYYYHCSWYV